MRTLLTLLTLAVSTQVFAADRKLCDHAMNNLYSVMYSSPKDKEKLKNPKVQEKLHKEIDGCAANMSAEKASCFDAMKAIGDLEKCAKM